MCYEVSLMVRLRDQAYAFGHKFRSVLRTKEMR